jgi:endonuclease/exonuclease/phosphatase family metal-dependent hydrolase
MDSGNAILSRWPIHDPTRIKLALSSEQDELTRQYYLKRNIVRARLEIPGRPQGLYALVIHADAYGKDGTKKKHVDRFKEELDSLAAQGEQFVAGGDLNILPPGSVKLKDFPDTVCTDEDYIADDYSGETEWAVPLYRDYDHAIPLDDYARDETRWYSHTVDGRGWWDRTLDHLFTNLKFVPGASMVHQSVERGGMDTMPLSDHAPLTGVVQLDAGK